MGQNLCPGRSWPWFDLCDLLKKVIFQKTLNAYNFKSIIDRAFIFHTETYWNKIYVQVAHDLDLTFVTYLEKVIFQKPKNGYNFESFIDKAFIFHTETNWVKIYAQLTYDLDVTFVTYL